MTRGIPPARKGKRNRTITFYETVTSSIFAHQTEKITTEK